MSCLPSTIVLFVFAWFTLSVNAQEAPTTTHYGHYYDLPGPWWAWLLGIFGGLLLITLLTICCVFWKDRIGRSKQRAVSEPSNGRRQRGRPQAQSNLSAEAQNLIGGTTPPPPAYKKDIELATLSDKSKKREPAPPPYYAPPSGPPPARSSPFPVAHMV